MFAIAALVVFILDLFDVALSDIELIPLGLALIAAHLAFGTFAPFPYGRRSR